jgi:hypothetical protein
VCLRRCAADPDFLKQLVEVARIDPVPASHGPDHPVELSDEVSNRLVIRALCAGKPPVPASHVANAGEFVARGC